MSRAALFVTVCLYLRGHEGDGAQELALELSCTRALGGQPGSRPKVRDPQPLPCAVNQQVGTYTERRRGKKKKEEGLWLMEATGCSPARYPHTLLRKIPTQMALQGIPWRGSTYRMPPAFHWQRAAFSLLTFDVSVDDLVLMQISQAAQQLVRVVDDNRLLEGPVLVQQVRYRATLEGRQYTSEFRTATNGHVQ